MTRSQPMIIHVIADRFSGIAHHEGVRTVSGLVQELSVGAFDELRHDVTLEFGQGIDDYAIDYLVTVARRRGIRDRLVLSGGSPDAVGRDIVHKHRSRNVLLADLHQEADDVFRAALRVHADNELLLDHQTGEHLQGMIVTEAARQMFLALFEVGYRHRWPLRNFYVVWNRMEVRFDNFLFPLPAEIIATVTRADLTNEEKLDFDVEVEVTQSGRRSALARIGFTSYDNTRIAALERIRAVAALGSTSSPLSSASERRELTNAL